MERLCFKKANCYSRPHVKTPDYKKNQVSNQYTGWVNKLDLSKVSHADFLQNPSECQTVWIHIRSDVIDLDPNCFDDTIR